MHEPTLDRLIQDGTVTKEQVNETVELLFKHPATKEPDQHAAMAIQEATKLPMNVAKALLVRVQAEGLVKRIVRATSVPGDPDRRGFTHWERP
jgi:hypothetical protein